MLFEICMYTPYIFMSISVGISFLIILFRFTRESTCVSQLWIYLYQYSYPLQYLCGNSFSDVCMFV